MEPSKLKNKKNSPNHIHMECLFSINLVHSLVSSSSSFSLISCHRLKREPRESHEIHLRVGDSPNARMDFDKEQCFRHA
jgi:hypothetical protein